MSRLLALDQSSKITGYAIFNNGKLETYGKFEFDHPNLDYRLVQIKNEILSIVQRQSITEVVYEDIQQQNNIVNNVQTFKVLAEVYGVISEALEERKIPHSTVLAATWKSFLGIKGKNRQEQKQNAQNYVVKTYGVKPTQDECDAICIGAYKSKYSANDWSNEFN